MEWIAISHLWIFKVVGETGKVIRARRVETNDSNFIRFVKSAPKPHRVIMEEGPLAARLLEICIRNGKKLVITDPKQKVNYLNSVDQDIVRKRCKGRVNEIGSE